MWRKIITLSFIICSAVASLVYADDSKNPDKGFDVTVDMNGYRFTVTCHYQPAIYGELTKVGIADSTALTDTLTVPASVVAYGDTFPVTSINAQAEYGFIYPGVIDFGSATTISWCNSLISKKLKAVILGDEAQIFNVILAQSSIRSLNLKNVVSLHEDFMRGNKTLTEVTGNNVPLVISDYAFYEATSLSSVNLPGIVSIGRGAFSLTAITEISLPAVETISLDAFALNPNLTKVDLNPQVKSVRPSAFTYTSIDSLNLYNASTFDYYDTWYLMTDMDSLKYLSSATLPYLSFLNSGMELHAPSMLAIHGEKVRDINLGVMPKLRQLAIYNSCIDNIEIPDSTINAYTDLNGVDGRKTLTAWQAVRLDGTAVGSLTLDPKNGSYIMHDSLLLSLPQPKAVVSWDYDLLPQITDITNGNLVYYNLPMTDLYNYGYTDTIAVAAIGYPRGEWFVPRNNPYNGVTYNIDFVDKVLLSESFKLDGYYLKTFARDVDNPVKIYVDLPIDSVPAVAKCCPTEAVIFIVPEGMLGRYVAAGLPADRTMVDTEGVIGGISDIEADKPSSAPTGIYTIDGRRISDYHSLSPGIYIIDGKKTIIR